MKSVLFFNAPLDIVVTGQTLVITYLLADGMALRTITDALKVGMSLRQVSRRELSVYID